MLGTAAGPLGVAVTRGASYDSPDWLKGAHGPPFFEATWVNALYFGVLGAAVAPPGARARLRAGLAAFAACFLVMGLPMAFVTRVFSWGEDPAAPPTLAWFYAVLAFYIPSCIAGAATIGRFSGRPGRAWVRAVLGMGAGYAIDRLVQLGYEPGMPPYLSGAVWGALMGLALDLGAGAAPARSAH